MPQIQPIPAVTYATQGDVSPQIAPPYDVLDETSKAALLAQSPHNIVAVDLPHLPPKTVGPDATYEQAGRVWRQWLDEGVLTRHDRPAIFVYQQRYTDPRTGRAFARRGLFANVRVSAFGPASDGSGGIHPHEQTFSAPKEDRLKLMRTTGTQLSPIFGLYSDPENRVGELLARTIDASPTPTFYGTTKTDGVRHELWVVSEPEKVQAFVDALYGRDIFIADGHHRYNTALNYREEIAAAHGGTLPEDHPANWCMFVLVAIQDPGMIVLPTHRVLGGMPDFSMAKFAAAAASTVNIIPFTGDLAALEAALPQHGPHAMGLVAPGDNPELAILTTTDPDPLKTMFPNQSEAWRQLDVAVLQHLIVEQICQPAFTQGKPVTWKFPHELEQLRKDLAGGDYQLGVIVQPTPLESVRLVSEAGELMPQKSTFFYPKLATGLVMNPVNSRQQ